MAEDFTIVFEQLALETAGEEVIDAGSSKEELDEIDELRRFAAEMNQPEPTSFTTT